MSAPRIAMTAVFVWLLALGVAPGVSEAQQDGAVVSDETIVIWVRNTTQAGLRGTRGDYFDGCIGAPAGTADEMARWVDENLGTVSPFLTNHAHVVFPRGELLFGAIVCPDDLSKLGGDGWAWWTIGGGTPSTSDIFGPLRDQALSQLPFPAVSIESNPDGIGIPLLAQLPVAFWPSEWPATLSASAAIPGYSLTVTSTLQQETTIEVDGELVATCVGQPVDLSAVFDWTSAECGHTFEEPTEPGQSYRLAYEMTFSNVASCADVNGPTPCDAGPLQDIVLRSERNITVAEARGLLGAGL